MTRASGSRTLRIGLTGPIGCGKSTVAAWLAELGAVVIDADVVAREATPPGSEALAAVVREFGPTMIGADGSLDRGALAGVVFTDPDALARLEAIIHPAVRPRILEGIVAAEGEGAPAVVIEAIKLLEGGLADLCHEVWLITCDPEVQRSRLAGRGAVVADMEARIAAQSDLVDRLAPFATFVLDTSGTVAATQRAAIGAYAAALRRGPAAESERG